MLLLFLIARIQAHGALGETSDKSDFSLHAWDSFSQGNIHILRHHIFGICGPPSPQRQHVFSTKNKQKLAFSDPPSPPTSADVIYEWSPRNTQSITYILLSKIFEFT